MTNQSAQKPQQPQKPIRETLTRPDWVVPTLEGLLKRLSVTSASPSKTS
jgi:hypothetical protein